MKAKEYLERAYWLDQMIDSKLEQVASLRAMATKTTTIMKRDVVSRSRNTHSMEDTIAKIADMEADINADIDRLVELKREIGETIQRVEDPELRVLLELRYLCFKDWPEIAGVIHRADSTIYKAHARALRAAENVMGSEKMSEKGRRKPEKAEKYS